MEIITFKKLGSYEVLDLTQNEPSCFHGTVEVVKYKITIEEIEERLIVIQERLEKLFIECDNWHHREALDSCAKYYDYKFKGQFGSQKKRRK